jgi:uncharacterized HhH-GPD family protein
MPAELALRSAFRAAPPLSALRRSGMMYRGIRRPNMTLSLPIDPEANALLARNPFALLMAMLLDQQFPMERAFSAPHDLMQRLGHEPSAGELADFDPEALAAMFSERPALHRYPRAMAGRVQELARITMTDYDGDAAGIWRDVPTGQDLLKRVSALPGFGSYKAQIFVALLGKQLGVRPEGWRAAAGPYGADGIFHSVADIDDEESLSKVRAHKQEMKAAAKARAKPRARN